jgi:hypothetical protein
MHRGLLGSWVRGAHLKTLIPLKRKRRRHQAAPACPGRLAACGAGRPQVWGSTTAEDHSTACAARSWPGGGSGAGPTTTAARP